MSEPTNPMHVSTPYPEPTDDSVADGTQLAFGEPSDEDGEGDAGVNDTGNEPWYQEEVPD